MVYMDENGDAEGNYTLLARQPHRLYSDQFGLYPVGIFTLNQDSVLVSIHNILLYFYL